MADAEVADDRSEASRFEEYDAHWWEVPDDLLRRCSAPFCFLEPQDLIYYLPAYMCWFLRTEGGPDSFSSQSLLLFLCDLERGGRIVGLLNDSQRTAIRAFLEHVKATPSLSYFQEDANSALAKIWRSSEPGAGADGPKAGRGSA
jgi:hypothetical protein